jgi:hypothetical protein
MTVQDITVEAITHYMKAAHYYAEIESQWASVVPSMAIPEKRYVEFVRTPLSPPPKWGMDWASTFPTATVMEKYEVMVPSQVSEFTYPYEHIQATAAWGLPVIDRQATVAFRQQARRMAQLIYQGDVAMTHQGATDLTGLTNIASPTGKNTSTYNTVKWNASTGPECTVANMIAAENTDKMHKPFGLVLGTGCEAGMMTRVASTSDFNEQGVSKLIGGGPIIYEDFGADSGNTINPLPAAGSADNVGILVKSNPEFLQALIARPPFMRIEETPALNNSLGGVIGSQMTIVIPEPKAVCYHDRIDYA